MDSVKLFTSEEIKQLRQPVSFPDECPDGWIKSQVEPAEVFKAFSALRLKKGFVLRAYQFRREGNGNAIVWAMPEDSPFPSPKRCPKAENTFLESPMPPLAVDDLMEAIEGDGSHWSYLSASMFRRQINEFGARWHGCDWCTHEIIDKAPSDYFNQSQVDSEEDTPNTDEWTWLEEAPKEWRPSVCKTDDKILVTFYSFSALGREIIYRHVDTFNGGNYSFKTKEVAIAEGVDGYVF